MTKISELESKLKKYKKIQKDVISSSKKLSPKQSDFLKRIYVDFPNLNVSDMESCLSKIQQTLTSNIKKKEELISSLGKDRKIFFEQYPEAKRFIVDYSKEISFFLENKKNEELERQRKEKEKLDKQKEEDELSKLVKVPKNDQKQYHSFNALNDAIDFFKSDYSDYFSCGQGFYEDEVFTFCFVNNSFFKVKLSAEIISSKQDVGDRLYWVESLKDVQLENYDFELHKQKLNQQRLDLIKQKEDELKKLKEEIV